MPRKQKLKGETDITKVAVMVIVVLVVLVVGMYIVNVINSTIPVRIGINMVTLFQLIGVALIVMVAGFIIWYLRTSLGGTV
ncbi:MAG: hypothetical protein ACPL3C_08360 [Pyrobaculum sp.]